jgi:hypothetical protein
MNRNLVLLLSSGHTVKIALRPDDLSIPGNRGVRAVRELLKDMPSVHVIPEIDREVVMAFVEDMVQATVDEQPNDFQRIDAYSPGEAL